MIECVEEKIYYGKKGGKKLSKRKRGRFLKTVVLLLVIFGAFYYYREVITKNVIELCADKCAAINAKCVNNAIVVSLNDRIRYEELVTVDFTALTDRISKVEALKEDDYTAETWAKLKTAYDKAKELNGKDGAVQSEVDAAVADLDAAITGLVKADGQGDANDDKVEKEGGIPVWVWIVIAAAVVIAAVVIVILVLSKKKKTKIDSEDKE